MNSRIQMLKVVKQDNFFFSKQRHELLGVA